MKYIVLSLLLHCSSDASDGGEREEALSAPARRAWADVKAPAPSSAARGDKESKDRDPPRRGVILGAKRLAVQKSRLRPALARSKSADLGVIAKLRYPPPFQHGYIIKR